MKASGLSRINRGFGSLRGRSAPPRGFSLLHVSALSVLLILMAGCVTEYSGGTQMSSDPGAKVDKRVVFARQYIGVGDWENAKRNLELAQEVDPNNAEIFEAFAPIDLQETSISPTLSRGPVKVGLIGPCLRSCGWLWP